MSFSTHRLRLLLWLTPLLGLAPVTAQTATGMPMNDAAAAKVFIVPNTANFDNSSNILMAPNGIITEPGWSLEKIGNEYPVANAFTYPDTTVPVRLYLIDTAVQNPESWVADNPNLTFEGTIQIPVGYSGDQPTTSVPLKHGTQLLSLIVGSTTGIAAGTPIHVLNYDVYPTSGQTTIGQISDAIMSATDHATGPNTVKMRSVICIATSSLSPATSAMLKDSIDVAVQLGITVVVSAGNLGQDASSYVPCAYGTTDGVICVGSSDSSDAILSTSNHGASVDILSPGYYVSTRAESATSPVVLMTGTSPATALVAGAALTELSLKGSLSPAEVENTLKASAKIVASWRVLRTTTASIKRIDTPDGIIFSNPRPLEATETDQPVTPLASRVGGSLPDAPLDSNSNGVPDLVETFHGSTLSTPPPSTLSIASPGQVQYKFPISSELFSNATPFVLDDGTTWKVTCSTNFKSWDVPVGAMSKITDAQGQAWLTVTFPNDHPSCFVRIAINPKPQQ